MVIPDFVSYKLFKGLKEINIPRIGELHDVRVKGLYCGLKLSGFAGL